MVENKENTKKTYRFNDLVAQHEIMNKDGYLEGLGKAFACNFIGVWDKLDPKIAEHLYEPCEDSYLLMDGFHLDHVWRTE